MKKRILKRMAAMALVVVAAAFAIPGCSDGGDPPGSQVEVGKGESIAPIDTTDLSGGVAVTVGDVEIGENAITAYLNNVRYSQHLQDDGDWGQWIFDAGYSMDGLRADTVEYFANQEVIRQAAAQEGLEATDAEVDEAISEARGDASDEEFANALDQQGIDEAEYRESVRIGLLQKKLTEKIAGDSEVDEGQLLEYLKLYYPDDIAADATTLEGADAEHVEAVRGMLADFNANQAFTDWMMDFRDEIGVLTTAMPEGLPYIVDLMPYEDAAYEEQHAQNAADGVDADEDRSAEDGAAEVE